MAENLKVKIPETENADDGIVVIQLRTPLDYNGNLYHEIRMDLEGLTGKDGLDVENELMARKKGPVIFGAMNSDYLLCIAAKACARANQPIGADAFQTMRLKDTEMIKQTVRNFLLR